MRNWQVVDLLLLQKSIDYDRYEQVDEDLTNYDLEAHEIKPGDIGQSTAINLPKLIIPAILLTLKVNRITPRRIKHQRIPSLTRSAPHK